MTSIAISPRTRAKRARPRHLEDTEAQWLMTWARTVKLDVLNRADIVPGSTVADYLIHIPNGGKRDPREAARFRAMGVKAGVSDYTLPLAGGVREKHRGLWLELKAGDNTLTEPQAEWLGKMERAGYAAEFAVGWVAAAQIIAAYLNLPAACVPER